MSYAVSKPAHDLSTAKFVACLSISFSHLFFRVFFAWCKIECKYLMFGWLLDLHLHTNTSLDVSEESEMDLWSDRFGSWIGRSSKSKSPDSMKHLRYDRKSSSGYLIGSRISCWCWFLHYLFARTLHTPNTLSFLQKLHHLVNVFICNVTTICCTRFRRRIVGFARFFRSHRQAIQFR